MIKFQSLNITFIKLKMPSKSSKFIVKSFAQDKSFFYTPEEFFPLDNYIFVHFRMPIIIYFLENTSMVLTKLLNKVHTKRIPRWSLFYYYVSYGEWGKLQEKIKIIPKMPGTISYAGCIIR